ncbi:MAG: chorismate synthase [Lachnoclostridium sp.]|nr:chorismate synthase [Lachnoclostridium sp.]
MDSFGTILTLTTFGESHGSAMGGVLSGVPAGAKIDLEALQRFIDRRSPGKSPLTSARREADTVQILSGLLDGVTLGTAIGFIVSNDDARSADYSEIAKTYRPSHADYTYEAKYGIRDYRGGGRASARETVSRVVAGGIALQILEMMGVTIRSSIASVGSVNYDGEPTDDCGLTEKMRRCIAEAKAEGDTLGGVISCTIVGVKAGVGDPVAGKLSARLGAAMLSIPAVKGFDYGMGFEGTTRRGSEMADAFTEGFRTLTNHSGGIQGGISNGEEIYFRVAFKPVATLMQPLRSIDVDGGEVLIHPRGRHDACVLPRALPIVEAMAALVVLDSILINRCARI